eukprot:TRINITY_DN3825_c0_g2_i2.p1 TRINITY_DN3825_c0_g2~~TRINITY_DN3825_c0_g2_i2.p1  ORF type:complete len:656 (-),score=137.85 TRINITY_DN3825_c0_g2_i2:18-1985(-)
MGIKEEKFGGIASEVDIIFNLIEFPSNPKQVLQAVYYPTLNLLNFAKHCKHLKAFVHLSTAYTAANIGIIKEQLHDSPTNMSRVISTIESEEPFSVSTLICSLLENKIAEMRLSCGVGIIRPTTVCASCKEPFPGWVDSMNALNAVHYYVGLGAVKELHANPHLSLDIVPVDICANIILASAMHQAMKGTLEVFHVASGRGNSVSNHKMLHLNIRFLIDNAVAKPKVKLYPNKQMYETVFLLKRKVPALLFNLLGTIADNKKIKDKADLAKKRIKRADKINSFFQHIANTEWIFDSANTSKLKNSLSKSDLQEFPIDISGIDWHQYNLDNIHGLWKCFAAKKVGSSGTSDFENVFYNDKNIEFIDRPFGNIRFTSSIMDCFNMTDSRIRMDKVLSSRKVRGAIEKFMKTHEGVENIRAKAQEHAKNTLQQMETRIKKWRAFVTMLLTNSALKQIIQRINVNTEGIQRLKSLEAPLILIPNHQSYLDASLLTYVMASYGMKVPFVVAAEEFGKLPVLRHGFRSTGAFFIKRGKADVVYKEVLKEYVKTVLEEGNSLEFFVEGTRSRRGKLVSAKFGIIKIFMEAYLEERVKEAYIVPVSVSYERVLEGESFIQEFEGKAKEPESFKRAILALGTIFEKFGSAVSYTHLTLPTNREV